MLKEIDKDKLFTFLREMEFNRLLSSAISKYGELLFDKEIGIKDKNSLESKISNKNYTLIDNLKKIENFIRCLLYTSDAADES